LKIKDQFFANFANAKKENIFCCQIFFTYLDIVLVYFEEELFLNDANYFFYYLSGRMLYKNQNDNWGTK